MKPGKLSILLALFVASVVFSMNSFGAKELGSNEIKQLLSGNTVDSINLMNDYKWKYYFDPNGTFRRIDEHGNKVDGEWELEDEGVLCMHGRKSRCWKFVKTDKENTYNIHARFGGQHKKIWAIIKGNPNNL